MRNSAWQALRLASSCLRPQACRFIAGRRFLPQHKFHTSPTSRREDDPPTIIPSFQFLGTSHYPLNPEDAPTETENSPDEGPDKPPRPIDKSNYGSAARRAGRNIKKVKELPPVHIPPWFLSRNVVLRERHADDKRELLAAVWATKSASPSPATSSESLTAIDGTAIEDGESGGIKLDESPQEPSGNSARDSGIGAHRIENMQEIFSVVRAGLHVPSWQRSESVTTRKPHIMLFCPKDGASRFLETLGHMLATANGTDFLSLSPQDIAEIGGGYLDEPSEFQANTISSLGYDAAFVFAARYATPPEDPAEDEEDYDESDEDEVDHSRFKPMPVQSAGGGGGGAFGGAIHFGSFNGSFQDVFKSLLPAGGSPPPARPVMMRGLPKDQLPKDTTPELKLTLLVETLLDSTEIKRLASPATRESNNGRKSQEAIGDGTLKSKIMNEDDQASPPCDGVRVPHGLIVLVQDYAQINITHNGSKFLDKLHEVVDARRKEGQKILIVGTTSSKDFMSSFSRSGVKEIQNDSRDGPIRTIVTPVKETASDAFLDREHERKTKETNLRHVRDMFRRVAPNYPQVAQVVSNWDLDLDSKVGFLSGLEESIWPIDRVSRAATIALGLLDEQEEMTSKHIERALELIESSDSAKYDWVANEKEQRKKKDKTSPDSSSKDDSKEWTKKLRKTCNDHERKLLNGVVHPEDIRTTFADVRAAPSTIDALKTLTSLSLVRPDAFTYGVLATDRIPGMLLYGPPGTGKTLLARAVAKESGATVLELMDVYDMYVGEGEKNVRAIFSLAKKLTPCIVFIDEADAILGARSGGSNRTSHRELINQFLREWDGMTETSAFIMVATNRPFDLDEASLRRLPRRLLVDLPVEKDREAILKIHLKDEILDPEVSLSQLASQTPFYSGSDLKNVAVAAALSCVREEFETSAAHAKDSTNDEIYRYPEKRTLHPRHFSKAMEEISASISEDMASLSAIRKFDEKYGDRRGRRKKGGYGFKTVADNEKAGSDAARVRNQT